MPPPNQSIDECVIEGCGRPQAKALKRGLCMECYGKAKKYVESGAFTWERLATLGLCLDPSTNNPFSNALDKALEKRN